MHLGPEDVRILTRASTLHDIGKLAFDSDFIHTPRQYTADERLRVQTHALIGARLLDIAEPDEFRKIASIAAQHHERWDGSGYPRAIAGKQIHGLARLVSIADVFDALASDRTYRTPWPEERIRTHFLDNRACQFDPDLTERFLDCYADCATARESAVVV